MFTLAFNDNLYARGAAISVIILLLVAVVIVPYLMVNARAEAS